MQDWYKYETVTKYVYELKSDITQYDCTKRWRYAQLP